jgi:hypothetical protein
MLGVIHSDIGVSVLNVAYAKTRELVPTTGFGCQYPAEHFAKPHAMTKDEGPIIFLKEYYGKND